MILLMLCLCMPLAAQQKERNLIDEVCNGRKVPTPANQDSETAYANEKPPLAAKSKKVRKQRWTTVDAKARYVKVKVKN